MFSIKQKVQAKISFVLAFGMSVVLAVAGAGNSGADSIVKLVTNWGSAVIYIFMVGLILVAMYKVIKVIWDSR